jgi:hypothetical protein
MGYHDRAFQLTPDRPAVSKERAELVRKREDEIGFRLPESVREWYLLDDAEGLLHRYSNSDYLVPLAELGKEEPDWYGEGPRDFVAKGLLFFMAENQGVCDWAVKLGTGPDPAVVVQVDTAPNEVWLPCADRFSTFMYCQVWDNTMGRFRIMAHEPEVSSKVLRGMGERFEEQPRTYGWPGQANYRYQATEGRVLIHQEHTNAEWWLASTTRAELAQLLELVEACGADFDSKQPMDWSPTGESDQG